MTIPFQDLARLHATIRTELDEAFDRVLGQSAFVGAGTVSAFEHAFAHAHGLPAAVGCASGTDALSLALRAAGIGAGDEVIVPSMTFIATAEAVLHVGAVPAIADVDAESLMLTQEAVDAVRTDATRAVIPVHLYGGVADPSDLRAWRDAGLFVLEDAAQAHLASNGETRVGTVGQAAAFSFYPGKNLGALGDAGIVASADPALLDEVRRLRDHGRRSKYEHDVLGWASRLDGLQAAFLEVKLRHLPAWTAARQRLAEAYRRGLKGLEPVRLVPWPAGAVHHLLVVRVAASRRAAIVDALGREGIGTGIHYPLPLSRQPSLAQWAKPTPVAEVAASEVLSLPMDPLMSDDEVEAVCAALARAVA